MTPITQVLASCALAAVIVAALWQSAHGGSSVGQLRRLHRRHAAADRRRSSTCPSSPGRSRAAWPRSTSGVGLIDGSRPERGGSFDPGRSAGRIELRGVTLRYRADAGARARPHRPRAARRRDGRARRPVGRRQDDARQPAAALPRADRRERCCSTAMPLAEWNVARAAAPVRARQPGRRPLQRHGRRQRLARQRRRRRRRSRTDPRGAREREPARVRRVAAERPRHRRRPQRAASSRAASASAWRSRARSTRTRRS